MFSFHLYYFSFYLSFRLVRKLVFLFFNVNLYLMEIPCLNKVTIPYHTIQHLQFSPNGVAKQLAQLNPQKACGPDELPSRALKEICCKVMEHIVLSHMAKHLSSDNILIDEQHGFRQRSSCETQLISAIHNWVKLINVRSQMLFYLISPKHLTLYLINGC